MATRKLFNELMAGIAQMKAHRQRKITLRSTMVPEPPNPASPPRAAPPPPCKKARLPGRKAGYRRHRTRLFSNE
jgi:hypothetical protein